MGFLAAAEDAQVGRPARQLVAVGMFAQQGGELDNPGFAQVGSGIEHGDVVDQAMGGSGAVHGDQQITPVSGRDLGDGLVEYLEVIGDVLEPALPARSFSASDSPVLSHQILMLLAQRSRSLEVRCRASPSGSISHCGTARLGVAACRSH